MHGIAMLDVAYFKIGTLMIYLHCYLAKLTIITVRRIISFPNLLFTLLVIFMSTYCVIVCMLYAT